MSSSEPAPTATAAERQRQFDALFAASDDPWQFRQRWYEARKRALTLASLPHRRYAAGYEPGCANGELSAALAERCDRLLVTDGSAAAVALAEQRLAAHAHVVARQAWLPDEWPDDRFDLIVISELAYFLDASDIQRLARCARASLTPGGVIVGCHWRAPIDGFGQTGDQAQTALHDALAMPVAMTVVDADFRLAVWCDDTRSTAQREGLR